MHKLDLYLKYSFHIIQDSKIKKRKHSRYFKQKKFNIEISCLLMCWNGLRYSQISKNAIPTGLQGEMVPLTKLGNQNILLWQ